MSTKKDERDTRHKNRRGPMAMGLHYMTYLMVLCYWEATSITVSQFHTLNQLNHITIPPLRENPGSATDSHHNKMCEAIDTAGNDTFAGLYGAMNIYYNSSGDVTCFDLFSSDPHGMDEWSWQACTEMILPTQGSSNESIFPAYTYNYTDYALYCQFLNGVMPRPHWITTEFGGHNIKRVLKRFGSNIIFFNGLRDPWSGGGVLESISKSLIAIVEPQGAHHVDLRFSTKEDPGWLKNVRRKEVRIIRRWLEQYYSDSKTS